MSFERINKAFAARMRKLSKKVVHGDLIDPDSGDHQDVVIGTLPPGACIVGRSTKITAYFTGGGASAVNATLGVAADPDAIMAGPLNIFDTTTLAVPVQGTDGVAPFGGYGGQQIIARIDVTGTLLGLTTGEVDFEIFYTVPDAG